MLNVKYDFNVYRVCLCYCVDLLVVSICHQCESTRKGLKGVIPVLLLIKRVTFGQFDCFNELLWYRHVDA